MLEKTLIDKLSGLKEGYELSMDELITMLEKGGYAPEDLPLQEILEFLSSKNIVIREDSELDSYAEPEKISTLLLQHLESEFFSKNRTLTYQQLQEILDRDEYIDADPALLFSFFFEEGYEIYEEDIAAAAQNEQKNSLLFPYKTERKAILAGFFLFASIFLMGIICGFSFKKARIQDKVDFLSCKLNRTILFDKISRKYKNTIQKLNKSIPLAKAPFETEDPGIFYIFCPGDGNILLSKTGLDCSYHEEP
ncbi:hypothetical protein ACFL35_14160 [Candidatus Riflebacteria bacterium]